MAVAGFMTEGIGVAAMAFYLVHRRLPLSPLSYVSIGGRCFFGGVLFIGVAQFFTG